MAPPRLPLKVSDSRGIAGAAALAPLEWKLLVLELAVDGVIVSVCMCDKFKRGSSEPWEVSSAACGDMGVNEELDEILTLPGAANKAGHMVAMVRHRQTSSLPYTRP